MKQRLIHGLEPRSKTTLISDWLRFRCHSAAGVNDMIFEGSIGGVDQAGTKALAGGTVAPYADRGWITPDGTTGSYASWTYAGITAAFDNFFSLDTLDNVGGLLVMCTMKWGTANTVTGENVFEHGQTGSARSGIALLANGNSAANQNIKLQLTKVGTNSITEAGQSISAASVVDVEHAVFGFYDCKNHNMYLAMNGNWTAATVISLAGFTGSYPTSVIGRGTDGLGIITGVNSTGVAINMINSENAGGDMAFNNLTFIRFEKDMIAESGVIAKACAQHAASPREIPSILSGY